MDNKTIYRTARPWQLRVFPLAGGINNSFLMLMNYVSYVAAGGYGIAVAVIGMLLTFTRIFDGITDPLVALLTDRIKTKYGKIRILLWTGWGIMSLSLLSMFFIGIGHGIVVFTLHYLVYIIGYTVFGVATNTANPVITNDPRQRPLLARWSTYYSIGFMMGLSMVMTVAILPRFNSEYSIPMMQASLLFVIVLTAILLVFVSLAVTPVDKMENFEFRGGEAQKIGVKDMWSMIKENRALQMFIVAASSDKLALQTAGNTAFQTLLFGVLIGNMSMSAVGTMLMMPATLAGAILATKMAIKKGNKQALCSWTWVGIIGSVASIVSYLFMDLGTVFKAVIPTVIYFTVTIVRMLGQNGASACTSSMLADVADYEAYRSGNFMPGSVVACYSFVDKLISSLATTFAGFSLALCGYANVMPQPGDDRTVYTLPLVIIMTLVLPMAGWLCTILAMKFYPLTREKMVDVQTNNHKQREAAKNACA